MNDLNKAAETQLYCMDDLTEESEIYTKGRNSRRPKKANHGARPCSSVMRKLKKKGWYNKITDK